MKDTSTRVSKGLSVDKTLASDVISLLQNTELIDNELKIKKNDDKVIIPIKDNLPNTKLYSSIDYEYVITSFPKKSNKPNSIQEYLQVKLPKELHSEIPNAFEQIGTIAVIDLRNVMLSYSKEIAKAILTLHKSVKSVYRKSSKVDGLLRLRGLTLIGGISNSQTIHKEYDLRIFVDIAKIYFSPRLATEHRRIAEMSSDGEYILDMFGGAGAFSLHIAQLHSCKIISLDINPNAPEMIRRSILLNKRLKGKIYILEGDAYQEGQRLLKEKQFFNRIIMNHPSAAEKFLPLAEKLLSSGGIIHYYTFAPIQNTNKFCEELINTIAPALTLKEIHQVRQSSPSEYHICLTLQKKLIWFNLSGYQ